MKIRNCEQNDQSDKVVNTQILYRDDKEIFLRGFFSGSFFSIELRKLRELCELSAWFWVHFKADLSTITIRNFRTWFHSHVGSFGREFFAGRQLRSKCSRDILKSASSVLNLLGSWSVSRSRWCLKAIVFASFSSQTSKSNRKSFKHTVRAIVRSLITFWDRKLICKLKRWRHDKKKCLK